MTEQELKDYASKRVDLIEDDPSTWSEQRKLIAAMSPGSNINGDGKARGAQFWSPNSFWRRRVDNLPADVNSANWVWSLGVEHNVTINGAIPAGISENWGDPRYGIPTHIIDGNTQRIHIRQDLSSNPDIVALMDESYPTLSDPGPYPMWITPRVQQTQYKSGINYMVMGDKHVFVIDKDNAFLHEFYNFYYTQFQCWAGVCCTFDLLGEDHQRPWGWCSGSVSGAPQFAGVVWYDEVASGRIDHALAFTALYGWGRPAFTDVASLHQWGGAWDNNSLPPFGACLRLKSSFNIDSFPPQCIPILRALKEYGAVYVDGGHPVDIYYSQDDRWDWGQQAQMFQVLVNSDNFDFVQTGEIYSFKGPLPPETPVPEIKLCEVYPSAVVPGEPCIVYWDVTGHSMQWLSGIGALRKNYHIFYPTEPTSYTVRAQNKGGYVEATAVESTDPCEARGPKEPCIADGRRIVKAGRIGRQKNFRQSHMDWLRENDDRLQKLIKASIEEQNGTNT